MFSIFETVQSDKFRWMSVVVSRSWLRNFHKSFKSSSSLFFLSPFWKCFHVFVGEICSTIIAYPNPLVGRLFCICCSVALTRQQTSIPFAYRFLLRVVNRFEIPEKHCIVFREQINTKLLTLRTPPNALRVWLESSLAEPQTSVRVDEPGRAFDPRRWSAMRCAAATNDATVAAVVVVLKPADEFERSA